MRTTLLTLLLLLVATVAYGTLIEPRFLLDDEVFEAELPALPAG